MNSMATPADSTESSVRGVTSLEAPKGTPLAIPPLRASTCHKDRSPEGKIKVESTAAAQIKTAQARIQSPRRTTRASRPAASREFNPETIYFREINSIPLLTREEEKALAIQARDHGDLSATKKLVAANLRFVVKIAHDYSGYGCRLEDLIQEGNLGLLLAVRKFDPHRNYRLITYAVWWIRATILGYIMRSWSLVKLGTTQAQRKLFSGLNRARRELAAEYETPLQGDERIGALARKLNVRDRDVFEMELRMSARDFSLDAKINDELGATTFVEMLPDSRPTPEDLVEDAEFRSQVRAAIDEAVAQLPEREREVLKRRVMTDEPVTLNVLAHDLGVSRERVRQIENNGKRRIRDYLAETSDEIRLH